MPNQIAEREKRLLKPEESYIATHERGSRANAIRTGEIGGADTVHH